MITERSCEMARVTRAHVDDAIERVEALKSLHKTHKIVEN